MDRRPRNATINHNEQPGRSRTQRAQVHVDDERRQRNADARRRQEQQRRRQLEKQRRQKKKIRILTIAALLVVVIAVAVILIVTLGSQGLSNLKIESSSDKQILTWKGNSKDTFNIYQKKGDGEFALAQTLPEGSEMVYIADGLDSATLYEYKITTVKGSGEDIKESEGKTVSAYTLPTTPGNPSAVTRSKDSLTCSWSEDQTVNGYELRMGTNPDLSDATVLTFTPADVQINEKDNTRSYTIPDLPEGSSYSFSLRSYCGEDVFSDWTAVFSGTVTRAVDMTGIDINAPMVALTFDDGPDSHDVTARILDTLAQYNGHATFFQLGSLGKSYPETVKRIVDEGSELGCHSYDHSHLGNAVTADDIIKGNDALEAASGVRPTCFRSPGGETTDAIRSVCEAEGQPLFYWNVDTRDWSSRNADAVVTEIQNNVSDGSIILMHNLYTSTADAVERIVPWLVEQGYQLVTASQLVQAKTGEPPVPGKQYYNGTSTN